MIRNFKNGDLATSGVQFAQGRDETVLAAKYRLRMFLGENFLNITDGTPWFQSVLGKTPQDIAEVTLRQRLATTPGVRGIERFDFRTDRLQRRITVSAVIIDDSGERQSVELDEEIA